MYLERIEVVGFRGINRISLSLNENTVLIGENAWGKSSLLDALTLCLSPQNDLYRFEAHDFYFPPGDETAREHHLQIVFTFCESLRGHARSRRYHRLSPLWQQGEDRLQRIYFRQEGELSDDGTVCTWRSFLNEQGEALALHHVDLLARELIRLHPVLRLRDARFIRRLHPNVLAGRQHPDQGQLAQQLADLTRELVCNPQKLSNSELRAGLGAMQQLLEHYFAANGDETAAGARRRHRNEIIHGRQAWRSLENINQMIAESGSRNMRLILLGLFSTLLQAQGAVILDHHARPLLLIEDPETRLHPIMLSVAWGLLNLLPLQKVTTTNSGDLLALMPVERVCRLVRQSGRVATYRIGPRGMSPEDSRRIAFHIRFNRASSLFARCWLLVEGETEVWLLSELARQCGYHFDTEGIKVIEFAQCGLRPLIKFARRMGIAWHVLVDGDEAGRKYAATVRGLLDGMQETERDRLTMLPAPDMEHFMYHEGFAEVYHQMAGIPASAPMAARKVIIKAIHRSSKPDLAILVAARAEEAGVSQVPLLLKNMFSRVLWLARGKAD